MDEPPPDLLRSVRERVAAAQRSAPAPGVVAILDRGRHRLAEVSVGLADIGAGLPADAEVQFRLGSITKTMTAVGVMQQVAGGHIQLGQALGDLWPGAPHGDLRIGELLSHTSGLQREPVGEVWESLELPSGEELAGNASAASRVLPSGQFWHYSNLAFALLGEALARVSSQPWERYLRDRVLDPLGMSRTTWDPVAPHAVGYSILPYSEVAVPEPALDSRGIAPAAQLWSTASDLSRWAEFLAVGSEQVLPHRELEAMRVPRVLADLRGWTLAFGLGLMLVRRGEHVYVGHTGSMPGFLAAAFAAPATGASVAVLANCTAGLYPARLATDLLELLPAEPDRPWSPAEAPPPEIGPILGRWWSEGAEWIFTWREGRLRSHPASDPTAPPDEYRQASPDTFVTESGPERGEELRVVREPSGKVVKLYRATYPFTREPRTFAGGGGTGGPQGPDSG